MSAALPARAAPTPPPADPGALRRRAARAALALAWSSRNPWEPFVGPEGDPRLHPVWYRSLDGWEAPLHRLPPRPGGSGEPVVLAHAAALGRRSFGLGPAGGLIQLLHDAGHDVWTLGHRGDSGARAPAAPGPVDLDAVVHLDLPPALDRVRAATGAARVLWVGHGLGGQLAVAALARGVEGIAGAALLGAATRFPATATLARAAGRIAGALPPHWRLPVHAVATALSPTGVDARLGVLTRQADGPARRGLLTRATADLRLGFARQAATWLRAGALVDRDDQVDYVAALTGLRVPLLCVAGADDPVAPPWAARGPADAVAPGFGATWDLGPGWSHLDLLTGPRAARELHPRLVDWLGALRSRCWG